MSNEEFCKKVSEFGGETIDSIEQIAFRKFTGKDLKEFVEHCIEFNNVALADVNKCATKSCDNIINASIYCEQCSKLWES